MRTGADVPNKLDNLAKQVSRHCQRCHLTSKKETNSWKLSRTSGQKSQEIFWKEEIKRAREVASSCSLRISKIKKLQRIRN